jgi:LacI family transcriptional regulator
LIDCGCQSIVYMNGPKKYTSAGLRLQGYLDVCREQGRTPQTIDCNFDFEDGLLKSKALLNQFPGVDGIIAANDIVALSLYKVLTADKIAVPDQVQIIGFDNIYLSNLMTPSLTTIGQPINRIGTLSASIIIAKVEGETIAPAENILPVELIIRETTRPLRR